MTNNTTTNSTADSVMDLLSGNLELVLMAGIIAAGLTAYGWLYVPQFKFLIAKLIKKHDAEILELYEKHLTGNMRRKLDAVAEKHIKDEILKQVVLTAFDHTEKKAQGTVKKLIRDIAKDSK